MSDIALITGRRTELITTLARDIEAEFGVTVEVAIVDFNSTSSFDLFITSYVINRSIGFLVNSVGFSNRNIFFDSDFSVNHKMIQAHISCHTQVIHHVVQGMRERRQGSIVTVSSLVGFLPSLHDPFYSGTKSFLNTYSESIALILREFNITVQSLCPGFTHTDFHNNMNLKASVFKNRGLKRWMSPVDVVNYSYKKLGLGKVIVIPGIANKIIYTVVRLIPRGLYYRLASKKKML